MNARAPALAAANTPAEKGDRGIDVKKAIVEPLPLCTTLGKDPHSPFPLVPAENLLGK